MYSFRLLGGVSLEGPDGPVTGRASQRRSLAVLALLALIRDPPPSRDKLVGLLWPDLPESRARRNLSDALYALRQALGDAAILSAGDEIALDGTKVWTDVAAFEEALGRGAEEEAVTHYGGDLLDGFYLKGARDFEKWVEAERVRLRTRCAETFESLARGAEEAGDREEAIRWWRKRAGLDPLDSRAAVELMEALRAAGSPAAALRHGERHGELLDRELGLEAPEAVTELMAAIRSGAEEAPEAIGESGARPERSPSGEPASPRTASTPDLDNPVRSEQSDEERIPAGAAAEGSAEDAGRRPSWPSRSVWAGALVVAVVLTLLMASDEWLGSSASSADPRRVVVADASDATEGSEFGEAVTEALRIDLAQSPSIRLVARERVSETLERMERPADSALSPQLAREVAIREGIPVVVGATVRPLGSGYQLAAEAVSAEKGETLAAHRVPVGGAGELLAAIDSLAERLREGLGESTSSIDASPPLERVTTSSLEALRKYSLAQRRVVDEDGSAAVRVLEEAVEADSSFAMAWLRLSSLYANFFQRPTRSLEAAVHAYRLRDRLTERERYLAEGRYHRHVTGDLPEALEAYRALLAGAPDDRSAVRNVADIYAGLDDVERSIEYHERAIALDSAGGAPYVHLAVAYMNMGDFEEADRVLSALETHHPGAWVPGLYRAFLEAARGRYGEAERILRSVKDEHRASLWLQNVLGRFLAYAVAIRGRLAEADSLLREVQGVTERLELPKWYLSAAITGGWLDALVRDEPGRGLRRVRRALAHHPMEELTRWDRDYAFLAELYALAGETGAARRLLAEEDSVREPFARTAARRYWRQRVKGVVALREERPAEAVELLRPLSEMPRSGACRQMCQLPSLARAREAAGDTAGAVATYERFLEAPSNTRIIWDAFYRGPVLERLARLESELGRHQAARRRARELATLWEDADPELRERARALVRGVGAD